MKGKNCIMSGSNERNLIAEIEILKMALAEKQGESAINFRRNVELEESLQGWQEKFQRLYESHKRVQNVNQNLEEKLLKLVDKNTRDRAKLANNCATLNIRLNKSNARIVNLQNEVDRYKKDISLAIHLLRCNPNGFIPTTYKSLPDDVQSKFSPYIKSATTMKFGGYQAVPSTDIFTSDELDSYEKEKDFTISPVTVSKFLECELKKKVAIETNTSINIYPQFDVNSNLSSSPPQSIDQKQNEIFDQNFTHHKMCDRIKASTSQDSIKISSSNNDIKNINSNNQQVVATKTKEPKNLIINNNQQQQLSTENGTKQFENFNRNLLSFVKTKKYKNGPRLCAMRINDEGIYLDDTHEIFIKKKAVLDIDDVLEKTESICPLNMNSSESTTIDDEIFSVNKTDSEKFNEIKGHSKVDASHSPSENEVMKNQRIAEWIKSSVNASIPKEHKGQSQRLVESTVTPNESFDSSLYNDENDLLQMEFNVKQFLLKQEGYKNMNDATVNCIKLHRTETNL